MVEEEDVGHHHKAAIRLTSLRRDDRLEVRRAVYRRGERLHAEGLSGGFEGAQVILGIWRRCRVEQECDPHDARRGLLEQLQPLAGHRGLDVDEARDVAARLLEVRDEAAADRIGNGYENDRNGSRLLQDRCGGACRRRENHIRLQRDELLRELVSAMPRPPPNGCRSECCERPSTQVIAGRPVRQPRVHVVPDHRSPSPRARRSGAWAPAAHALPTATPPRPRTPSRDGPVVSFDQRRRARSNLNIRAGGRTVPLVATRHGALRCRRERASLSATGAWKQPAGDGVMLPLEYCNSEARTVKPDQASANSFRSQRPHPCVRSVSLGDELPPPHSITSSARARSSGGISSPIALALLRLTAKR